MGTATPGPDAPGSPLGQTNPAVFSQPFAFHLKTRKPNKTVDLGRNGLSVSLDAHGRVLQASNFHPIHGIVVAVPFEQFDGSKFFDPSYVRAYRTRMLQHIRDDRGGFGLDLEPYEHHVTIQILSANSAVYQFSLIEKLDVCLTVTVTDGGVIEQRAQITNSSPVRATLRYTLNLGVSLNRASYGQLTEGGPVPLPQSHNILSSERYHITIENPHLNTQLLGGFDIEDQAVDLSSIRDQETFDAPLDSHMDGSLVVHPGATARIRATFRLVPHMQNSSNRTLRDVSNQQRDSERLASRWKFDEAVTTYIVKRNVDYILANCVIPISSTAAAVIADHVALPLGWNRDNYWQIRLLLETYSNLAHLAHTQIAFYYAKQIRYATKGHLNWVFKHAQRPNGYWHRSYLVNGLPKDRFIFQLDQQCYPLLELCDYLEHFPDEVAFVKSIADSGVVQEVLDVLLSKRDTETRLWPTDETPGDDAVLYPYHFSSHVLLWRTFTRLVDLFENIKSPYSSRTQRLRTEARQLREKTIDSFTFQYPESGKMIFAYLTDGHGRYTYYHDANDLPTLFARDWGLVSTPEEVSTWTNTMDFGLSTANKDAYCSDGSFGGLGSVHSPGAWTLGYFQEFAYAAWTDNTPVMQRAWTKIVAAMQWDGTFSEAVDPWTATCTSKAWFSWPGAMIGILIIHMKLNGQEKLLLGEHEKRR